MIRNTYCNNFLHLLIPLSIYLVSILNIIWSTQQYIYWKDIFDNENDQYAGYCTETYVTSQNLCSNDPVCQWSSDRLFSNGYGCLAKHRIRFAAIQTLFSLAIIELIGQLAFDSFGLFYTCQPFCAKFKLDLEKFKRLRQHEKNTNTQNVVLANIDSNDCRFFNNWVMFINGGGFIINLSFYEWIKTDHDNSAMLYLGYVTLYLRLLPHLCLYLFNGRDDTKLSHWREYWLTCISWIRECWLCIIGSCSICVNNTCGCQCCLPNNEVIADHNHSVNHNIAPVTAIRNQNLVLAIEVPGLVPISMSEINITPDNARNMKPDGVINNDNERDIEPGEVINDTTICNTDSKKSIQYPEQVTADGSEKEFEQSSKNFIILKVNENTTICVI